VLSRASARAQGQVWMASAVVAALPAVAVAANLPFTNRASYHLAGDYARNILGVVEPRGLLLTLDWQVYAPMLYTRHVEGLRRDVAVIDVNMLRRSWYFGYLEREYPAVMARARAAVDPFLDELRRWERDPDLYERDLAANRRINERFQGLVTALMATHLPDGPVYVTQDLLTQDRETSALVSRYTLVPQWLVFQVFADPGFREPADPALEMRGLFDGTIAFAPDDVVRLKVAPVYVSMLVTRGRYLSAHGHRERALALLNRALALDPQHAAARESLRTLQ
jgi:hypothetical protein